MAKREEGQTAGSRLEILRAQMSALLTRKRELSATTSQPDTNDPVGWAAKAGVAGAEVAAIDRALPMLEAEARAAEAQLKAAREAEAAEAAERMRGELPGKLDDVIAATSTLSQALDALLRHEQAIRALGGWVPQSYTGGLRQALSVFLGNVRRDYPELLGLAPGPTTADKVLADARAEVVRRQELLEQAKQMGIGPRGELAPDKDRLIAERKTQLESARRRVKELEAAAKEPRPKLEPVKTKAPIPARQAEPKDAPAAGPDRPRTGYWEE